MGLFFADGKLVRNLKTNTWQKMVLYYDYQGRVIQDFHLTNLNKLIRKDNQYRFNGELLSSRYVKKNGTTTLSTKVNYFTYDHAGRKLKYLYSLNGNLKTIASYSYDAIGRMTKKLYAPSDAIGTNTSGLWTNSNTWQGGSLPTISDQVTINQGHTVTIPNGQTVTAGTLFDQGTLQNFGTLQMGTLIGSATGTLQILDYKYHIRGGLKAINTDANNNLTSSLFSYKLEYEDDGTYFDGNIRKQTWKSNLDNVTRSYSYNYDGASRITQGLYTSTKANENYNMNSVSYDANGNILALSRNGFKSNNTFGLIDNLNYTYNANSNKILKVDDVSNETASFKDVTGNDYDYWADGSLKKDNNKQITQIDYNYLKLPEQITLTGGRWIKYDYDADGVKLRKTLSTGKVTDYEEDDIYEDGILYQTSHDEGRIVGGVYEYNITDHLGNLRVAFKDSLGIAKAVQYENRGAWGESLEGIGFSKPNKNRYSYSTYENQEDFGINVFDAHARVYDATAPRFWQIDPLAEKMKRWSPFSYGFDNPLRFTDPDGMAPGEYYNERGEKIGDDGKKDNKVYVVKTTQTTEQLYGGSTAPKGNSNPITEEASASTESEIRNGNFQGDHMKNIVQIQPQANMEKLTDIASKDDGTGGIKPENNREYGAVINNGKGKPIEGKPGPVVDPNGTSGSFETMLSKTDVDMHTHPSGTKRVVISAGVLGTAQFGGTKQPPGLLDIKSSNSKVNYVFGMRDRTIYMYNKTGVIATIPISTFKKP